MSKYTFELNSIRKDSDFVNNQIHAKSPVVEVFSAMVSGNDVSGIKVNEKTANAATAHITDLYGRANNGDMNAASELNTLRRFVIEPLLLDEIKLLSLFGSYKNVGYNESIEREVYNHAGEMSRMQAPNGDVVFPAIEKERYPVGTQVISGGYVVDYRAGVMGALQFENEGMEMVRRDIRNKAMMYIVKKVYGAIKNATGVKYFAEDNGITKTNLDAVVKNIRRFGRTSILGDYSTVSQINAFAGWSDNAATPFQGISDAAMEEIRKNGLLGYYNGSVVAEIPNPYNLTQLNEDATNFVTYLPEGLMFVIPAGGESPVATWTRGGLTSMTGNHVATGHLMTRFDLEVAVDVAKGREFQIGLINDISLSPATDYDL